MQQLTHLALLIHFCHSNKLNNITKITQYKAEQCKPPQLTRFALRCCRCCYGVNKVNKVTSSLVQLGTCNLSCRRSGGVRVASQLRLPYLFSGGSRGREESAPLPLAQNFFFFMQFSWKIAQIIG